MMKRFHLRVEGKGRDASAAPVLIVALGDSVTQGCFEVDRMDPEAVYHHGLQRLLENRHPQTTFSVINAGCGGESASGGLARLDRDVIRHAPDLLLVAYGLNDASSQGLAGLAAFSETLAAIVRRTRQATNADVVLLTPNMMLTRDNDAIPDRWRAVAPKLLSVQADGTLAAYARAIRQLGIDLDAPVADVYAAWEQLALAGVDTAARLANGLNHPTREMHRRAAELILRQIEHAETDGAHEHPNAGSPQASRA